MTVDIFITTTFKGNFACCTGAYGIILQLMVNGTPKTKKHLAGWSGLSYQKLNVRAVAEAMGYMQAPCDVIIHIDNPYIESVIKSGGADGKYGTLWLDFFAARNRMKSVTVKREKHHEYASYLRNELKKENYTIVADI